MTSDIGGRTAPFCPNCGREVDEDYSYCPSCGQKRLRLINVIDVVDETCEVYDIKDNSGKIVSHVFRKRELLCANCGRELADNMKYCSSCGVTTHNFNIFFGLGRYISRGLRDIHLFEGIDGTFQGKIRRSMFLRNISYKSVNEFEIFDSQNQLRAKIHCRPPSYYFSPSYNLRGFGYLIDDPLGKNLGKYNGDRDGNNYQILTPTRNVIAKIHKEKRPNKYYVYISQDCFEHFLVISYVIAMDIVARWARKARQRSDGGG